MALRLVMVAAGALALLWPSAEASACSCRSQSMAQNLKSSHAAFVGKASSRVPESDSVEKKSPDGTLSARFGGPVEYSFALERELKGALTDPVVIKTAGSGAMCGMSFEIGKSYVVFAYRGDDELLSTGLCAGNSLATPDALAEINAAAGTTGTDAPKQPPTTVQPEPQVPAAVPKQKSGCAGCSASGSGAPVGWLLLAWLALAVVRRRTV